MTSNPSNDDVVELRETSWLGVGLCIAGGFVFILLAILIPVFYFNPPKNPLPAPPWVQFVLLPVSMGILGFGIYLIRNGRIGMRLKPDELELTNLGVSIPWSKIAEVETLVIEQQNTYPSQLLLLTLTSAGKSLTVKPPLTNSPHASKFDPLPDVCVKLNFNSLGPGVSSISDFAVDLRRRIAVASGTMESAAAIDAPALPPLDGPLELRDVSGADETSRVYICNTCGNATEVSGSSLRWVANPLRYTSGGCMCATCGRTFDTMLRWADTGESVSRFRSRMWRRTPLIIKLSQFLFVPAMIGVVAAIVLTASNVGAANIKPAVGWTIWFGVGSMLGLVLMWLSPLADILPGLAGLKYHKYR